MIIIEELIGIIIIINTKSGFKEPSSNPTPLKTLDNDGKKKEKISEKNIYMYVKLI